MHQTLAFRLPLICLALVCLTLATPPGLAPARAEMLQFSTPEGTKSWPKLPDIPDWHQDQDSSLRLEANSLIPDGVDFAGADVTIQARGFARRGNGNTTSLQDLTEKDRTASPTSEVKKLADIADKDGTPFMVYSFAPAPGNAGSWKAVAYSEEGDTLLAFTLNARSKTAYDKNFPVFAQLIQRYARDIPW